MISFNGQYSLKLLLWVWRALILFFLIRFTNWKAQFGENLAEIFSPQARKNSPHVEMPSQTHEPPAIIIISDNYRGQHLNC